MDLHPVNDRKASRPQRNYKSSSLPVDKFIPAV